MQGLAVFYRTKQLQKITEDELSHVVVLQPENGYVGILLYAYLGTRLGTGCR